MNSSSETLIKTFSKTEIDVKEQTALKFINLIYDYAQDSPLESLEDVLKEDIVIALINEIDPDFETVATAIEVDTENTDDFGVHYANYNKIVSSMSEYFTKNRKCGELYIKKSFSFKDLINVNLLIQKDKTTLIKFVDGIFLLSGSSTLSEFIMQKINDLEENYGLFFIDKISPYVDEHENEFETKDDDNERDSEEERDQVVERLPASKPDQGFKRGLKKTSSTTDGSSESTSRKKPKYEKKFTTKTSILYGNFDKPKLIAEIDKLRGRNEELEKFKTSLIASVTALEEEKRNFDEKYDLLQYETNDWIDKYNEVVAELTQNARQSETIIMETNKELNKVTDLENQLNIKKEEFTSMEEIYSAEEKKYEKRIFDLQNDVEMLLAAKTDSNTIKDEHEHYKKDTKQKIKDLKEKVNSYESDQKIFEEKIIILQEELERSRQTEISQREIIKELEGQLEDMAVNINSLDQENKRSVIFNFNDDNFEDSELNKEKEEEFIRTREKNKTISMKLNQKEGENLQLKRENTLLRKQSSLNSNKEKKIGEELEYYRSKHTKDQEEIVLLNMAMNEKDSKYENALVEIEQHTQQKEMFKRLLNDKQAQLDEKEQKYIFSQKQAAYFEEECKAMANKVTKEKEETYKEAITKLEVESQEIKDQYEVKVNQLKIESKQIKEEKTILETELKQVKDEFKEKVESLEKNANTIKSNATQYEIETKTVIEDFKVKIAQLEIGTKAKEETIVVLESELSTVNQEYKEKISQMETEATIVKQEHQTLQLEMKNKIEQYKQQVTQLKTKAKNEESEHKGKIITLEKELSTVKEELKEKVIQMKTEAKLNDEKHRETINAIKSELSSIKVEYNDKVAHMETISKATEEKQKKIVNALQSELNAVKAECNNKVNSLQLEAKKLKEETIKQLETQLKNNKENYKAKIAKIDQESKEKTEKHIETIKQLETQLAKSKEEHKDTIKKMESERGDYTKKISLLEHEAVVVKRENKERVSSLEAEINKNQLEHKEKVTTLELEKEKMRKEAENDSNESKRKVNQLSKEKSELITIVDSLEKKIARFDGKTKLQLDEKELMIKKLQNYRRQYQMEINNLQKVNEMYCKETKERENEIRYYKQLIDQIKAQQKNEYDTLTSSLYELTLQFKIVRNDIAKKGLVNVVESSGNNYQIYSAN